MKLAVFSDTHGSTDGMVAAARRVAPDVLIHLGDHIRDAWALRAAFPALPLYAVAGNCDYTSREPDTQVLLLGSVRVLLTHGHRYGVKNGTDALLAAAREQNASLALYGHTHVARCEVCGGVTLLNPGSAGTGRAPTFAVAELGADGGISCRILNI